MTRWGPGTNMSPFEDLGLLVCGAPMEELALPSQTFRKLTRGNSGSNSSTFEDLGLLVGRADALGAAVEELARGA